MNNRQPGERHHCEIDHGNEEVRCDLADDHVDRAQRHHGQLLERALFTFAHHAEAGDHRADEQHDQSDQRRHDDDGARCRAAG
ncbi:MAG: hypothetical protein R2710_03025 [Acidimicrobiales bacterium]